MKENFLDEYPLDYLISNKDIKSSFYRILHNSCVYLLDGHKPDDSELDFAWKGFRIFVFVVAVGLGKRTWTKVYETFVDIFNHTYESPDEFMKWIMSDMINETLSTPFDWEKALKIPIEFPQSVSKRKVIKPKKRDKHINSFFHDYVEQGGGRVKRPSDQDIQSFAKETLQLIEEPKTKEFLEKISFGRFKDWLPEEMQKTLDSIGKLKFKDGKMLIAAKPLLENWKNEYIPTGAAQDNKKMLETPKQKGRYRLTGYEIKFRRQKVNEATKIKKDNPQKQWKEIDKQFAEQLSISERTFRSWRHNNY